jgi:NAD(P)-dependent dehydrogenase (short-subunit alcohol dehydrogenase family)
MLKKGYGILCGCIADIAPLGVEGDAWDIAQAALFLAGPESRFVTGVTIPVDGGATSILPLTAFEMASAG